MTQQGRYDKRRNSDKYMKHVKLFLDLLQDSKREKQQEEDLEFMYLVFTRMPGECCCRRFRSVLFCSCDVFRGLILTPLFVGVKERTCDCIGFSSEGNLVCLISTFAVLCK